MTKLWNISVLLSCVLLGVHASSKSSSSSTSESSNDVSSVEAGTGLDTSPESEVCTDFRTAIEQAIVLGSLDVTTLFSDVPLTSLNNRLDIFTQAIRNGDVTSEGYIVRFVAKLSDLLNDVIDECGFDLDDEFKEENLPSLLEAAFEALLQDLTNGFLGCFAVEDFLQNDLIFREDRPNFFLIIDYLPNFPTTAASQPFLAIEQAAVFNLLFHDENVATVFNLISQPIFAEFLELLTSTLSISPTDLLDGFSLDSVEDPFLQGNLTAFFAILTSQVSDVEFVNVIQNTCNIQLSDLQLEAISDFQFPDFFASVAADVSCQFIGIIVEEVTRIGSLNQAVVDAFNNFPLIFYRNFAPAASILLGMNVSVFELPLTDPVQLNMLRNGLVGGFQRCVPELNDSFLSIVEEFVSGFVL